ncbi:MAG: AAA family ATPase, partial [Rhodospirillaceae bacterium]|nr:AAA family ATPase [Rhodospirillaceae bacterium]
MADKATDKPWFWIIGGPNGAGKTTVASQFLKDFLPSAEFINADEFAKQIAPGLPDSVAIMAGKQLLARRDRLFEIGSSFAIETTLASRSNLVAAKRAKLAGWKIGLVFVWLNSPELAIERVAERVRNLGHSIPKKTILRRYSRSMEQLENYIEISDRW